ncbi:MAG: hypoxanthine phosphoribosyltransferase [Crocinitomicaceae bacterium]|nr:hypoxanthine phosphoribosyltransferase [Crocinitomicaceae bacterium]
MIQINDKSFDVFIQESEIAAKILEISSTINTEYKDKELVFIAILNGAFMFASDLMKNITIPCEISFVKVSSYEGMSTSGRVDELIGLNTNIENKHVIILEDIVDTGITIDKIRTLLTIENPASLKVCTLLYKPSAFAGKHAPELVGFSIPNKFVVGYGLDYDEKGRNLKEIYQIKENNN